jgi:hypothetical protein
MEERLFTTFQYNGKNGLCRAYPAPSYSGLITSAAKNACFSAWNDEQKGKKSKAGTNFWLTALITLMSSG